MDIYDKCFPNWKKKIKWKCECYGETGVTRNTNPWEHLNCRETFLPSSESLTFKICHFGKKAINGICIAKWEHVRKSQAWNVVTWRSDAVDTLDKEPLQAVQHMALKVNFKRLGEGVNCFNSLKNWLYFQRFLCPKCFNGPGWQMSSDVVLWVAGTIGSFLWAASLITS